MAKDVFTFEISLSVLDHLGRNLYRSFITVLGEAVSNSWDAIAHNVWIYVDKEENTLLIKDDGEGMNEDDFQHKFLKIGYSKRKEFGNSYKGRPFIGRKGIGKLALLSCAEKITIISKVEGGEYVGGVIENSGLDNAIKKDLVPDKYPLGEPNISAFSQYTKDHKKGTIIFFEKLHTGIRNQPEYLKKIIALYFRFSLIDNSFNIFLNDVKVTLDDLSDLAKNTQFLWVINKLDDPYVNDKLKPKEKVFVKMDGKICGFIASVIKPRYLKIDTTDEKVTIDLFVNGRLREKNILEKIPTERVVESYLYGQIHYDTLDDKQDRFTSSREGIIPGDPKYDELLKELKEIIGGILNDWDKFRVKHKFEGDSENKRLTKKERSSLNLFNAVTEEYALPEGSDQQKMLDGWIDSLQNDAQYNFSSYADCFISENLIRKYIKENNITLTPEAIEEISKWQERETSHKKLGNISIEIRRELNEATFLDMDGLANLFDKTGTTNDLAQDARQYKPIRNAVMHTALLTDEAKRKLTTIYDNIRGRIKTLLSKEISKKD